MTEGLSVVGLGKLGLCLASCFAEKGFKTLGVDIEERVVNSVNQGVAPFFEPGLSDVIAKHGGKGFRATLHHEQAIQETNVTFLLVATPSNPDGSFSNRFIESALRSLAEALKGSGKDHHLFVISSTVMPGSTEASFIPILEKHSGRTLNHGFSVCYDPDFVALGNVLKGFLHPDLVVIGESSTEAGSQIEAIHRELCGNEANVFHMSIVNAELAKICLNAYITLKITFANSVGNLCERIPGADVDAITNAIGADRRISPHYFQGGLSFGGTCFPRDTRAYIAVAEKHATHADLIHAVDRINEHQDRHLTSIVLHEIEKLERKTVGILGLSFTANTPVVTQSPGIKLITELLKHDLRIVAYDPLAIENTKHLFGSAIEYVHSAESCLTQSQVCVITLRSRELKQAIESYEPPTPLTVIDCWRILSSSKLHERIRYVPLGRGPTA